MSDEAVYIKLLKTGNNIGTFKVTADNYTTPTVSLISPNDTIPGYCVSKTSFVVGSTQLDDTTNPDNDARMLFDKTNGAFRAGTATGTQWDSVNRGTNSTALGNNNIASGINSFAVGSSNTASGTSISNDTTVAIGDNNTASGLNAIAIGESNISSGLKSFTFGTANNVTGSFSIAIGNGILDGILDGNTDNNNNVYGTQSIAIGTTNTIGDPSDGAKNATDGSIVIGTSNILTSFTMGTSITGTSQNSFILGSNCTVTSADNATAIGQYCTATGANSFAIGYGTSGTKNTAGVAGKNGSVSIGYQNTSTGTNSFAIGNNNTATGDNSVAIGNTNTASGNGSVAIGTSCNTSGTTGSICMGSGANIDTTVAPAPTNNNFFWNGDTDNSGYIAPHKYANSNIRDNYVYPPFGSSGYNGDEHAGLATGGGICFWGGLSGEFRILFGNTEKPGGIYSTATTDSLLASSGLITCVFQAGQSGWLFTSDRDKKENLIEHDYEDTLDKIMEMPIYSYNFISYGQKNIGPVAQDFNRLFPSDSDPLMISSGSLTGVTLAGVKGVKLGLDNLSSSVNTRFASNSDATSALQSRIDVLEASLNTVSAQVVSLLATLEST